MKKFVVILCLFIVLSVGAFASNDVALIINGKTPNLDVPPMIQEGRTLVPLRAIFEALGQEVEWVADTQAIVSSFDGKEIKLSVGSKEAINKGVATTLDVPPQIKEGRTLIPLRFIAESLDKDVEWIADTRTVVINDKSDKPKEEPKPVVSNLPDTLEFGKYTNEKITSYILYIKNYYNNFSLGNDYSFKTTCINRPDLNTGKYSVNGNTTIFNRNEWKSFDGVSGDNDVDLRLFQLLYKDGTAFEKSINPYAIKANVKDGEVLEFEVQVRHNPTGEIKTYYTSYVW